MSPEVFDRFFLCRTKRKNGKLANLCLLEVFDRFFMPLPFTGLIIEEIIEEDIQPMPSECSNTLPTEYSVRQAQEVGECSQSQGGSDIQGRSSNFECFQGPQDNSEAARCVAAPPPPPHIHTISPSILNSFI